MADAPAFNQQAFNEQAFSAQDAARALLALVADARARAVQDPFGNPVLAAALAISRRVDDRTLDEGELAAVVAVLRDAAAADRAARLATYAGGLDGAANRETLVRLAAGLVRDAGSGEPLPLRALRAALERPRYACVFTAHPTFAASTAAYRAIAVAAEQQAAFDGDGRSHRPDRPTLQAEFDAALEAIDRGRDALDVVCGTILDAARDAAPSDWTGLNPTPVILASWVGLDTDGRTDIGWWDSLRLRLHMKRRGLSRLLAAVEDLPAAATLVARLRDAGRVVDAQLALAPAGPDPDAVEPFARALVGQRDAALLSPEPLLPLFAAALAGTADGAAQRRLCIARAGLLAHGLTLAHAHVRLNAAQLHNAARLRLGLDDPPADRSRRRSLLAAMDEALDRVTPLPVDFGALIAEQSSAARLMMLVAQVAKHVDRHSKVRFLVAETESGYSLLAALWLARLCGADSHVEISPLFETPEALENGVRVIEEALHSPHYRAYARAIGRVCLQFGYSDSGRYLGQLPASYLVERLKLRLVEALTRHGLGDVELVLFDTHGESIGRGAHPGSLLDRFDYLSPPAARAALMRGGLRIREESSFQGGDGYLLFATPALALATITRVMEHVFQPAPGADPIYAEGDYAAGFFATAGTAMKDLVEDPGYAALLGAFGPALLDPTGSRPSARQTDSGGPVAIRHPRELRAIPNNAILQQLGWCANVLHGIGEAARLDPELFAGLRQGSPRFRRALDLVVHAARHSDLDVLRATVSTLDPASWLDRAAHARRPGRAEQLARVAAALESLGLWQTVQGTVRQAQADQVRLRVAWPDLPRMADRQALLHAIRLAVIGRIWLLAMEVPEFSPRFGATPEGLRGRLLRLDVPASLDLLAEIFPRNAAPGTGRDYGEPGIAGSTASYAGEHERIFDPMRRLFGLIREITAALSHEVGAFG